MKKPSKLKRYSIWTLQLPLTLICLFVNMLVAIITFTYIRVIHRGIYMGRQMHKDLEFHEQGKRK